MPQVFVKEALEVLAERVDVLQNPKLTDLLGQRESVVLGGRVVLGFLHSIFRFSPDKRRDWGGNLSPD